MANNDTTITITNEPLVLVTEQSGVTVIPQPTPLTRLNYFDGKFLRASDLTIEQQYLRRLMDLSNQAGGPGVAYGYNLSLAPGGDLLNLGPGLAIDPHGRVLLLPAPFAVDVQQLIDRSRQVKSPLPATKQNGGFADCTVVTETPPDGVVRVGDLYLIVIGFAEALCGQEDVFGRLCEDACATSTDRPFLVEGLVVRALPLQLQTKMPAAPFLSQLHLRSRVASSYFEDERRAVASLISGEGLRSDLWCFGAEGAGGRDVPIGVLARAGGATLFLDAWIARRERIDTPAKRYWQWRMAMRPWDVFVAQILQFQCQLSDLFRKHPPTGGDDNPCADTHGVIREASDAVDRLASFYQAVTTRFTLQPLLIAGQATAEKPPVLEGGLAGLLDFQQRLQSANAALQIVSNRILIDGGIVELPSAGYLPVTPNSVTSVNQQVRRLLGKGVDLRFCIVRPDFVAHALEEAQHMDRISLLDGLDHPDRLPEVDILVPNGEVLETKPATGTSYEAEIGLFERDREAPRMRGAAFVEVPESGSVQFFSAVELGSLQRLADRPIGQLSAIGRAVTAAALSKPQLTAVRFATTTGPARAASLWVTATSSLNFFAAQSAGRALAELRLVISDGQDAEDIRLIGTLIFDRPVTAGAQRIVTGTLSGTFSFVGTSSGGQLQEPLLVSHEVTAILSTPDGKPPSFHITLRNRQPAVVEEISGSWEGSPQKITLSVTEAFGAGRGATPFPLLDAEFKQNDEVLLATNALHLTALHALETVGAGLRDNQFPGTSALSLFPPPPPAADDLDIRAVLDWVLFHRRRTKRCQTIAVAPEIPVRRYKLWHGRVTNRKFLQGTINALVKNTPFDGESVTFQPVDVVEFAPGIQTLISSPAAVGKDWKDVAPGPQVLFAGIASRDVAKQEGSELAKDRLGEVLAAISTPADSAPPAVLDEIHPDLAAPALDGIIVALTVLQTSCATVCAVQPGQVDAVQDAIKSGLTSDFLKKLQVLGSVRFARGTDTVLNGTLDGVVNAWAAQGLQKAPESAVVIGDGDSGKATALAQGRLIYAALQPTGPAPVKEPELKTSPTVPDCPVILFVAVQPAPAPPRIARVVIWSERDRAKARILEPGAPTPDLTFEADGSLEGNVLPDAVAAEIKRIGGAAQIELAPLEDDFDKVLAAKRLAVVREAVDRVGLLKKEVAKPAVAKVTAAERKLVDSKINDIIFVKRG